MIKILQYVKVYCKEDGDKSFPMLGDRERRNQFYLQVIKFRLDIRKNFLDKKVMQ